MRRTHIGYGCSGQRAFHFIKDKKQDKFIDGRFALNLHTYILLTKKVEKAVRGPVRR